MRKKTAKNSGNETPQMPATATTPPVSSHVLRPDDNDWEEMPDPDHLLEEAIQEPNYLSLSHYRATIRVLKEKGFSFREIAQWLTARNVEADYNAVYRVYLKGMSDDELADFQQHEQEEAEEEADRNR